MIIIQAVNEPPACGAGSQPVRVREAAALWAADGLRTRPTSQYCQLTGATTSSPSSTRHGTPAQRERHNNRLHGERVVDLAERARAGEDVADGGVEREVE